jgi:hypothetical protein
MRNVRLGQLALIAALWPGLPVARGNILATLAPTQASYLDGEPVELLLTIVNNGTQEARLLADYPSFGGQNHTGVRISRLQQGRVGPQFGLAPSRPLLKIGVFTPVLTIAPGESWSVQVYLQSYTRDLRIGANAFTYQIDICAPKSGQGCDAATGAGALQIIVLENGPLGLSEILQSYSHRLANSDIWVRKSSAEAFCASDSPLTIKYLSHLWTFGYNNCYFDALERFRGNAEAEQALLTIIRRAEPSQTEAALRVLESWNYALTAEDFRTILEKPGTDLKVAAFRYAEKIHARALAPIVGAHSHDSNEWVAAEATRVEKVLSAQ